MATSSSSARLLFNRVAFVGSAGVALGASGILFRDLTDFSQWVSKPSRNDVWKTYRNRHELMKATVAGIGVNTLSYWLRKPRPVPSPFIWVGVNTISLGLLFMGYINNELMFRTRNKDAMFVTTCQAAKILKPTDTCIVTQLDSQDDPVCFADSQIMRPHIARVGEKKDGTPAAIAYCGLTGTGIVYETPDLPDGTPRDFMVLTQLENNLVVLDRATGHIGHQINGFDETKLLEAMGEEDYDKVGRRPATDELIRLGVGPAKEVSTWRMTVGNFTSSFPHGKVFINDYKEFPQLTRPVKTIYDKIVDLVFYITVNKYHFRSDTPPVFPTVEHIDDRLATKTRVWGFNVGDDYVCVTEDFVKQGKNGTRNMTVGLTPLVASYDPVSESLGIWIRPNNKAITKPVDVDGKIQGELERLNTVKNGLFWFAWQNFFPQTDVNPTK